MFEPPNHALSKCHRQRRNASFRAPRTPQISATCPLGGRPIPCCPYLIAGSKMKTFYFAGLLMIGLVLAAADSKPIYQNDFTSAALNKVPDDMLVLDGGFAVKEENGNKFLELPG